MDINWQPIYSWYFLQYWTTFRHPTIINNLKIPCIAGKATVTIMGELAGYGTIWFHPDGIANITPYLISSPIL